MKPILFYTFCLLLLLGYSCAKPPEVVPPPIEEPPITVEDSATQVTIYGQVHWPRLSNDPEEKPVPNVLIEIYEVDSTVVEKHAQEHGFGDFPLMNYDTLLGSVYTDSEGNYEISIPIIENKFYGFWAEKKDHSGPNYPILYYGLGLLLEIDTLKRFERRFTVSPHSWIRLRALKTSDKMTDDSVLVYQESITTSKEYSSPILITPTERDTVWITRFEHGFPLDYINGQLGVWWYWEKINNGEIIIRNFINASSCPPLDTCEATITF